MHSRFRRDLVVFSIFAVGLFVVSCARSDADRIEEIRALHREQRLEESLPLLVELIESGNRDAETFYRYGGALSLTGHPERATWALDAAMADPVWVVRAGQQLAVNAYRSGNLEFGLETLERLEQSRPEGDEAALPELLLRARMMIETNTRYEEALEVLEDVMDRFPDEDEAVRLKAAALLGLERPDEAYETIRAAGVALESDDESESAQAPAAEASAGDSLLADAAGSEDEGDSAGDSDLDLEVEVDRDEAGGREESEREAYWCAIRVSFQRESRDLAEARKIADECLERFPDSIALLNEAVKLYGEVDPARVVDILRVAHEKNPQDLEIRRALTDVHLKSGRFDEAEAVIRKALDAARADEGAPPAQVAVLALDLADFLARRERTDDALVAFDEVRKILGAEMPPMVMLRHADALIVAKRYDEALEIANTTPVEVHRPMLRGRIAFEQGDYRKALAELDEAARVWPDNAPTRYYLARAAEGVGDFDRAIEEYRQAIRSDAALSAARERLARLHLAEGQVREAGTILRFRSPSKESTPSMAMKVLGVEVQSRLGIEPQLAIELEPGKSLHQLQRDTIGALARGLRGRAGAKTAGEVLAGIETQVDGALRGIITRERVEQLLQDGAIEEAVQIARKAALRSPDDDDVRVALGRALARTSGDLDEAERLLRSVVEKVADDAEAWAGLGEIAAARKDPAEAERSWDKALSLAPDSWEALDRLVTQLVASDRRPEAVSRLRQFLDRDSPYDGRAARVLALLLSDEPDRREEVVGLARRAVRFGGGPDAVELLLRLDPKAAARIEAARGEAVPPAAKSTPKESANSKPATEPERPRETARAEKS